MLQLLGSADGHGLHACMHAGVVDMIGRFVELPAGAEHFFTTSAFMLQVLATHRLLIAPIQPDTAESEGRGVLGQRG